MKWVEIITLRSLSDMDAAARLVNEILRQEASGAPGRPAEIRIYHHFPVETDLSIHIYWNSGPGSGQKSPLGLMLCHALRELGLLDHSVWVETAAVERVPSEPGEVAAPETNSRAALAGPKSANKEGYHA